MKTKKKTIAPAKQLVTWRLPAENAALIMNILQGRLEYKEDHDCDFGARFYSRVIASISQENGELASPANGEDTTRIWKSVASGQCKFTGPELRPPNKKEQIAKTIRSLKLRVVPAKPYKHNPHLDKS